MMSEFTEDRCAGQGQRHTEAKPGAERLPACLRGDVEPWFPIVVGMALFASAAHSVAAGIDCARAKRPVEQTVCASSELRQSDERLSRAYARLQRAAPGQREALRAAQLEWLKTRDQCGADPACLDSRYQSRMADLQARLAAVLAYRPDEQDMAALADLRALVEAQRRQDPVFPLEKALAQVRVTLPATTFANVGGDAMEPAKFPTGRPNGVTPDEWKALQASAIDGGGENGNAQYTLVDLDGDGRRDLVIDTYSGGTGLWSLVSVLRRKGNRFEGRYASDDGDKRAAGSDDDGTGQPALYSINGRGANQSADWIVLRGRVYAAYRDSHYGVDDLYLLRPFTVVGEVPKLTVRYRYRLSVPVVQQSEDGRTSKTIDKQLHAALTKALHFVGDERAGDAGADRALCPIPASVEGDERLEYYNYGPGHYSYETVADMPIHVGSECYLGRMVDWFGGYGKEGLSAQLWMRKPGAQDGSEQTFTVDGVRAAVSIETSLGTLENIGGS